METRAKNVLVAGWFSFEEGHATAGDLIARDVVCSWLEEIGIRPEVATAPPFRGGVRWRDLDPQQYSHVLFVCGPFERGRLEQEFLDHFSAVHLVGVDLSMRLPLDEWNPFDVLIERNSTRRVHPDLAFSEGGPLAPVVGVCLVEEYPEGEVEQANQAIERLVARREMAIIDVDTRLDFNRTGLRSAREVEALLARVDAVITTRLHGMVLALKHGVPAVAIDSEAGGAKIVAQAEKIGWPAACSVDQATDEMLSEMLDYCLSWQARRQARASGDRARSILAGVREELLAVLHDRSEVPVSGSFAPLRTRSGSARAVEVVEIVPVRALDPAVLGGSIDAPQAGDRFDGPTVYIAGWVLGRDDPISKVEIESKPGVVHSHLVDRARPDVAEAFPDRDAAECGFMVPATLFQPRETTFELRALTARGVRVELGAVRIRPLPTVGGDSERE